MLRLKQYILLLFLPLAIISCQEDILSDDPTLRLTFSHDSLLFDTVFTKMGSSTKRMMVYNPHNNAILINRVEMANGQSFFINLDGENQLENLRDITLRGGDSLFLFVRAEIDPQKTNSPLVEDTITFYVSNQPRCVFLNGSKGRITVCVSI